MILNMLQRFNEWVRWRRLVRVHPLLQACWQVVANSNDYRAGPYATTAEIVDVRELYKRRYYRCKWFGKVRAELQFGVQSVAIISLEYLVRNAPQHRYVELHFVSVPALEHLGKSQNMRSGL